MNPNPAPERVSIRDLARIAGVSRTTVSLALRDSSEISAAMRAKIQALAREHDYRSHPAVNALMKQVGLGRRVRDEEIIAFIRSGDTPDERSLGPLEMLEGARREAHRLGFRIEVFWAGKGGCHSERVARVLYQRGIRGVVWGPMHYPHPPLKFPWHKFIPIACTLSTEVARLPTVLIHHANGMALVLDELVRTGAARIGVLLDSDMERRQDFGWSQGVDLYRHRTGDRNVDVLMLDAPPEEKTIRAWIRRKRLDALVMIPRTYRDTAWLGDDIARASLDVASSEIGRIGGLHQNMGSIGELAVNALAMRLHDNVLGLPAHTLRMTVNAAFVTGESLRRIGEKASRRAAD